MNDIAIRGKVDGKFRGVSSFAKPKCVQVKPFKTVIVGETIFFAIDKNKAETYQIMVKNDVLVESDNLDETI